MVTVCDHLARQKGQMSLKTGLVLGTTLPLGERIVALRGQRVMIDADLAELYGVTTKALNQAIKRNGDRFPADFMFRLTPREKAEVVTVCDHLARLKYSRTLPFAFTEHGAIQAANVLSTERAVAMGVHVVRAFVKLRVAALTHKDLALKLAQLDKRLTGTCSKLGDHDAAIRNLVAAVRELAAEPETPKRRIGFGAWSGPKPTKSRAARSPWARTTLN